MKNLVLHRIENIVDAGTPDVIGCLGGPTFWIELKAVPRQPMVRVGLRPEQAQFLRNWTRNGGNAWVLVQVGVRDNARRYLVHSDDCLELLKSLEEKKIEELSMTGGKDRATTIVMRAALSSLESIT